MAADIEDNASQSAPRDVDEITRENQFNSPLLRLPGEIRNRIYEYVFFGSEMVLKDPYRSYPVPHCNKKPIHVLATCQQIRHEATTIFWDECTIDARFVYSHRELESAMGSSNCARITSLVVDQDILMGPKGYGSPEPIAANPLANFPLLRKVCVEDYYFDLEEEAVMRCIRAKGVEVEFRERDWTETDEWVSDYL